MLDYAQCGSDHGAVPKGRRMDIATWLGGLGLERYLPAFREHEIDAETLAMLSADDLQLMGVTAIGHRNKLMAAIAALAQAVAAPSLGSAATASGERRHLTVMFCDLVGSTTIAGQLDPEEWHDIVVAYHRAVAAAVTRFGGYVAKNLGDGALVYFGYPQAQENDAERAACAGLAILEAIETQNADLARRGGPALAVRVGIHAGPVVIGEDADIYGEVPNIAARVQTAAEPGSVLISRDVHNLSAGRLVVRSIGPQSLKGVAEPIELFQVIRAGGTGRWRLPGRAATPLIGRDAELAQLCRSWKQARAGQSQLVMLVAEAGLGKSRLTEEFQNRLADTPHTWAELACSQLQQNTPFHPFLDFVKRRLEDLSPAPEGRLAALAHWHRAVGLDPARSVPLVAPLLDVAVSGEYSTPRVAPDEIRRRLLATLADWIAGGARAQPFLLLVEDVHWADPSTLDLLRVLAEPRDDAPVMLLLTGRPEFQAPWPSHPHHDTIELAPLERGQALLMAAALSAPQILDREVAEILVTRTGGVPLFIEEVTRFLLDHAGEDVAQQIPLTLQSSLTARLDRLGAGKELAQIAAVLGRGFSYALIRAVAAWAEDRLATTLELLGDADIIEVQGTPPDASYRFRHALLQDAAYGTLLRAQRQSLHQRIASVLEEQFPEIVTSKPDLLARHCTEAGLAEKALGYRLAAGRQAFARSAMAEAVAQFQAGLDLLAGMPAGPQRLQQELNLQIGRIPALGFIKGHASAEIGAGLARTRALTEQLGHDGFRVMLLASQWVFHLVRAELALALPLAAEMERMGDAGSDLGWQLSGLLLRGMTHLQQGEFNSARAILEQCLRRYDPRQMVAIANVTLDLQTSALANLAVALTFLGHLGQGRRYRDEALSRARGLGQAQSLAEVLRSAIWIDAVTASPEHETHAAEQLALSQEHGFAFYLGSVMVSCGWTLTIHGQAQEGLAAIIKGLAATRATGAVVNIPLLLTRLADNYGRVDQPAAGLDCLDEAARIIDATGARAGEAPVHRLRGDLLKAAGNVAAAERSYERALDIARGQNAKLYELQASVSLARLWFERGERGAAQALLAPILDWFTEGFEAVDLQAARMLAGELAQIGADSMNMAGNMAGSR